MGNAVDDAPGRRDGIVLRQAQSGSHIVGGAHGKVAHGRGIVQLHKAGQHLAERPVPSDAGNDVIIRGVLGGEAGGIPAPGGEKERHGITAAAEGLHRLAEIGFIRAASRHGIDDQHEPFKHVETSF